MSRRLTPAERARRKVARLAARSPLFAHAGILDQVADVAYDARRIADEDVARALAADEARVRAERAGQARLAIYRALLAEAAGPEEAAAVEAAYARRWRDDPVMRGLVWRLDHLCAEIARQRGVAPLAVFAEAGRRLAAGGGQRPDQQEPAERSSAQCQPSHR